MKMTIQDKIAEEAGIKKAHVKCSQCNSEHDVDGGECLRTGWPECCGKTMTLVTDD